MNVIAAFKKNISFLAYLYLKLIIIALEKFFLMDFLANTCRFASKLVNKAFLGHF